MSSCRLPYSNITYALLADSGGLPCGVLADFHIHVIPCVEYEPTFTQHTVTYQKKHQTIIGKSAYITLNRTYLMFSRIFEAKNVDVH